jgi:polyisoprenoid-binding protein YceI
MKTFALALLLSSAASAVELKADPAHSTAGFAVKHMMFTTVRGSFNKFTSTIDWNEADPTKSTVTTDIDVNSVDTRQDKRDADLKSPNFFDAAKCPTITFKSTKIEKAGEGYKMTGDLTMHCVTQPVTLDAQVSKPQKSPFGGGLVYTVAATGKLKRSDWGLKWNKALEGGGVLVSDDVDIEVNGEYSAPKK